MALILLFALFWAMLPITSSFAILRSRQSPPVTQCNPVTITVYHKPETVTMILVNTKSIAAQAAWDSSVDAAYVTEQSQLRPTGATFQDIPPTFTHELTAPAFTATEDSNGNYIVNEPSTTSWGNIPTGNHLPVGLTSVTFYPAKPSIADDGADQRNKTITLTVSPLPASATSNAVGDLSSVHDVSPHSYSNSSASHTTSPSGGRSISTSTVTRVVATSTVSVDVFVTASSVNGTQLPAEIHNLAPRDGCGSVCVQVCFHPFGCWCNSWGGPGVTSTATCYSTTVTAVPVKPLTTSRLAPRQTCTVVSAEGYGTWCNNWEGITTNDYTVWETTTTPGVPVAADTTVTVNATLTSTVKVSVSSTASPTSCGESGPFVVDFDQLPIWGPSANETQANGTDLHPALPQTVDHFIFNADWTYGPPPAEPYVPHDKPYLGWYIPGLNTKNTDRAVHNTGFIPDGASFGSYRGKNSAFWFNANSAFVGCDNQNLDPNHTCDFVATAFNWIGDAHQVVATQHFTLPPCASNATCQLHAIRFNDLFVQLSAMSFYANVQGQLKAFFMDSLALDWYDNNCTAGLERIGGPKALLRA